MSLITGRNTQGFAKDTVYRFMKMLQINWIRFTTLLASRIIRDAIVPLDSEDRANVLIIDGPMFERSRSKKDLKTRRTGATKQQKWTNGLPDISRGCLPCRKGRRQCWSF